MKKIFAAILGILAAGSVSAGEQITVNGAGASFPAPVYQNWTYSYGQSNAGMKINYQSLGSGAGLNQIKSGTVDFAGSDNPLSKKEQDEAGLVQFPMLTGGVVVIVNLPGVKSGALKLSREALAGIFLGKITRWDDKVLKALNPSVRLPRMKITVVRRADASGTSYIFTNYLSKISAEWRDKIGFGSSVKWPVGIGGQKNPGVCNNVAKIRGSIGYTEYTYAVEARLNMPSLENRAGAYVSPGPEGFRAGAANADWKNAPGFQMVLTDQPGKNSWPIVGVTYILIRRDCPPAMKQAMIRYFNWCFTSGSGAARKLHYVPIPENVVKLIQNEVFK